MKIKKKPSFRSFFVFAGAILLAGWATVTLNGGNPTSPKSVSLTEEQRKVNLDSFEEVWKTIRDKHYDPKLGGLDWQAVHAEFEPKVAKADSQKEVQKLLNDMLDRLNQSHFGIIPAEVYDDVAGGNPKNGNKAKGVAGFDVRIIGKKAYVVNVDKGTPAEKVGVKPGWEIVQIGKDKLTPIFEKVAKTYKDSPRLERELAVSVIRKLRGKQGDKIEVTFHDGQNKEVKLAIPLIRPKGNATTLGNLPTMYVHAESKKLDKNIAYFSLNTFADPLNVMPALQKTVKDNLKADGFIIDIRGNPGGIGGMAMGFGGWFVNKPSQKLGTMITRAGSLNFVLSPRAETFDGPLAILVDGLSGSTSEIFAGGMKDLKRAKIFGTKTMGAALPSVIVRLPNKDGFQYAIANYVSVGGKALEGNGVVPDVVVPLTQKELLAGRDSALEAAIAWIQEQKEKTTK